MHTTDDFNGGKNIHMNDAIALVTKCQLKSLCHSLHGETKSDFDITFSCDH